MHFLQPFLQRRTRKSNPKIQELCRDEAIKKSGLKVKKRVHFDLNEASLINQRDENCHEKDEIISQGVINYGSQIKILMRKEEAARFLSKCNDGGILQLKDIAADDLHLQLPNNRVHNLISTDEQV